MEIVVVNAGSRDGTDIAIRDYLGCITYVSSLREPIYVSWNRAIRLAQGEYLTNANADDRLHPEELAIMAQTLDDQPDIGLVYCDAIVTSTPNARWDGPYTISERPPYYGAIRWPEFDPEALQDGYFGGPSPMWRRALHERYGLFDESYQLAGDYEFALRLVAHGVRFRHIARQLCLFFDDGAGINHATFSGMEARRALLRWRKRSIG